MKMKREIRVIRNSEKKEKVLIDLSIKPNGTTENSNKANARVWNIGWFQTTYSKRKQKAMEMQGTRNN